MDELSMMYPSIDIDCETQEQADKLIELFNQFKKEFECQPINEETKMQMQMRLRDIQHQLDSDKSYQGVSFKLNGGFAYNKSTWYLEDITAYHEFYCNDNATNYAIPSYIDVNNMLFDLKAAGVLQAYTPVIPCCISTILPRYEKPYPADKTITVEVRYDARDKMSVFQDCEYRYMENDKLYCENKQYDEFGQECDNCKSNIHLNCDNYNPKKDMCLKFFKDNISSLKECQEKTTFSDKELSRKWSN